MSVLRRISAMRRKQIVSHVDLHLLDEEQVVDWARSRHPHTKKKGFVYLTDDRFLMAWRGGSDEDVEVVDLGEVSSWELDNEGPGEPTLSIHTPDEELFIVLQTRTPSLAQGAREFVRTLARLTPEGATSPSASELGFKPDEVELLPHKSTVAELTKRIIVTVIGGGLIIAAPIIAIVPGPWSILLVIAGLAILSSEYDWAEDALDWARAKYRLAKEKFQARKQAS